MFRYPCNSGWKINQNIVHIDIQDFGRLGFLRLLYYIANMLAYKWLTP